MNFPTNPAINTTYTIANRTWIWNGSTWTLKPPTITDVNNNLTIIGNVTATSFIKTGGTGTQFLMADGTVVTYGITAGSVAEGNHTHNLSEIGITGLTTNYLTKFNGSTLVNSQIYDNGSNIGLGTTTPARKLTIYEGGTSNYQLRLGASASHYYEFGRDTSNGLLHFYGNQSGANGYIFDGVNGERMRINESGNVGIGTTTPTATLDVNGAIKSSALYVSTEITANDYIQSNGAIYALAEIQSPKYKLGNGWDIRSSGTELQFFYNDVKKGGFSTNGFYSTGEVTAFK